MTSKNQIVIFNNIISNNRKPKELGYYDYIDISKNTTFYKLNYYKNYLFDCVNYISIIQDNYIYLFLLDLSHNNIQYH